MRDGDRELPLEATASLAPEAHQDGATSMLGRGRDFVLTLLFACGLSSCAYRASLDLPDPYTSVGIEIFSNSSYERDIEAELHRAMVRSTRDLLETPLVAPGRGRAFFRGEILDYRRRGGIRSSENVQVETGVTIRVRAELYDPVSNEALAGPITLSTQIGYALDRRTTNEAEARDRALALLAERIVIELTANASVPGPGSPESEEIGPGSETPDRARPDQG